MYRLVISGAAFTDEGAADALRGFVHSKLDMADVIEALFPSARWMAFMEDGHPADIPPEAVGVELYPGHRAGGLSEEMLVRWYEVVAGVEEIRRVLGDPAEERIRGFVAVTDETDLEDLWARIFLLVGMGTLDSPPARYQPAALPEILDVAQAVVVLHRDKHGPALGIYTDEVVPVRGVLEPMCERLSTLLVPFAIPPMLARWDRAIHELREQWTEEGRGEAFPVPSTGQVGEWEPRWRRRQRNRDDADARREMLDGDDDFGGDDAALGDDALDADDEGPDDEGPDDEGGDEVLADGGADFDLDDLLSVEDDEPAPEE